MVGGKFVEEDGTACQFVNEDKDFLGMFGDDSDKRKIIKSLI